MHSGGALFLQTKLAYRQFSAYYREETEQMTQFTHIVGGQT